MELLTLLLVIVVTVLVAVALWEFRQRREPRELDALEQRLTQRVDALHQELSRRVDAVQQSVTTSLADSRDTLRQTTERLTSIDTAARRIIEEVAPAVASLQDLLKAPGLRGGFGEYLLEQLLADALPAEHYAIQHAFRNGDRVDAIIRLPEGIVPIDSKFPLNAFQRLLDCQTEDDRRREAKTFVRDVRGHVDAVAKYIRPDEGTLPFALMYIPSEGVYYEVMVRDELSGERSALAEYCRERNVFPVSPNTFYSLLQAIAKGLRGLQVEERAREIIGHLERLQSDFRQIREKFAVLGTHLTNAKSKYDDVVRDVERFDGRLALPLEARPLELPERGRPEDSAGASPERLL